MGKFLRKKLFEVTTGTGSGTTETMWAYTVVHDTPGSKPSVGRFRIRITRLTAAEMMESLGASPDDIPSDLTGQSLQAYLEKWSSDHGWMACLDWLGGPNADNYQIEDDLCRMFKAFITGEPEDIAPPDFSFPPPSFPKKKTSAVPPKKSDQSKPKQPPKDETPDFDWI